MFWGVVLKIVGVFFEGGGGGTMFLLWSVYVKTVVVLVIGGDNGFTMVSVYVKTVVVLVIGGTMVLLWSVCMLNSGSISHSGGGGQWFYYGLCMLKTVVVLVIGGTTVLLWSVYVKTVVVLMTGGWDNGFTMVCVCLNSGSISHRGRQWFDYGLCMLKQW